MNLAHPLQPNPDGITAHRRLGRALPRRVMRIADTPDPNEVYEEAKKAVFSAHAQRRILGLMSDGQLRSKREIMAWTGLGDSSVGTELAHLIKDGLIVNFGKPGAKGQYQRVQE